MVGYCIHAKTRLELIGEPIPAQVRTRRSRYLLTEAVSDLSGFAQIVTQAGLTSLATQAGDGLVVGRAVQSLLPHRLTDRAFRQNCAAALEGRGQHADETAKIVAEPYIMLELISRSPEAIGRAQSTG